jgi:hypothetical protein
VRERGISLRVIPKTHLDGVVTDEEISWRAENSPNTECTITFGGVIAMDPLIIHASAKAESQPSRRVLHVEHATSSHIGDGLQLAIV